MGEGPGPQVYGADYQWTVTVIDPANVWGPLAPADPTRVYLGFSATGYDGNAFLSTDPGGAVATAFGIPQRGGPFELKWKDHGSLVCAAWFGVNESGTGKMVVVAVSYRPVVG